MAFEDKKKRILVFRIGHLGDTLIALPAFWTLRKTFPEAHLALLSNVNEQNPNFVQAQSVLPKTGLFDEWISYPSLNSQKKLLEKLPKLLLKLRQARFDTLVYLTTRNRSLNQLKRDLLFFRLAGIKKTIGIKNLESELLKTDAPRPLPEIKTEAQFLLDCLQRDGIEKSETASLLHFSPNETEFAQNWLRKNCLTEWAENRLVGIAPGAKWDSKIWPEERFAETGNRLIKEFNAFPVIFGGSEDRAKGNRLIELWQKGANAAGELNIRPAAAALAECRFYLGNDTGTMHLAACVGRPCVVVFASIDWNGRWYPFGAGHRVFRSVVPCEGCLSENCLNPDKNLCLTKIDTESVWQACRQVWEETAR
jgi:ADP-heptose:LPS heptosyltransferase